MILQQLLIYFTPPGRMVWLVWLAGLAGFLSGAITITARSLISKFVSPVELGRIFSVLAALQVIII